MKELRTLFFICLPLLLFVECSHDSANTFSVMNDSIMTALRDTALKSFLKSEFKVKSSRLKLLQGMSADNLITYSDTGTIYCSINGVKGDYEFQLQEHLNITKRNTLSDNKYLITGWGIDTIRLWQGPLNIYLVENNTEKVPYGSYGIYREREIASEAKDYHNHSNPYVSNKGQAVIKEECLAAASESDFSELNRVINRGDKEALSDLIVEGKVFILRAGENGDIIGSGYGKVCLRMSDKTVWVSSEFVDY